MNTTNHEYYVSFEVAKLLKKAGFEWEVQRYYSKLSRMQGKLLCLSCGCKYKENININQNRYSAPTLEVAQRWLREEKSIYIGITALENKRAVTNSDGWTFHYEYGKPTFDCDIQDERCENMCTLDDSFDTYEEALEVGIKKSLEIILDKGE